MALFHTIFIKDKNCKLTIPKFQNSGKFSKALDLYSAAIVKGVWKVEKVICQKSNFFYHLNKLDLQNKVCYFFERDHFLKKINNNPFELISESFTNTHPAFRSNLKIENYNGGYSSYQTEYPLAMVFKKGIIVSAISALTNKDAGKNYLIFSNVHHEAKHEKFNLYFVDIENRKVLKKTNAFTNTSNLIEIKKTFIKPNIYLCSNTFLGIPQYLTENNGFLSFEHTHPPHEYIQSKDRFKRVNEFKLELNEIIKENI